MLIINTSQLWLYCALSCKTIVLNGLIYFFFLVLCGLTASPSRGEPGGCVASPPYANGRVARSAFVKLAWDAARVGHAEEFQMVQGEELETRIVHHGVYLKYFSLEDD